MKNIKTSLLILLLAIAAGLLLSTIKNPNKTMQAKANMDLIQLHHCRGNF